MIMFGERVEPIVPRCRFENGRRPILRFPPASGPLVPPTLPRCTEPSSPSTAIADDPDLRLLRLRYPKKRHRPIPAKNANGRRTDKRIVPSFESPDFPSALATPAVSDVTAEDAVDDAEDS